MRRATCDRCGRSKPKAKMHVSRHRAGVIGPISGLIRWKHSIGWQCRTGCAVASAKHKARMIRKMRGDAVLAPAVRGVA